MGGGRLTEQRQRPQKNNVCACLDQSIDRSTARPPPNTKTIKQTVPPDPPSNHTPHRRATAATPSSSASPLRRRCPGSWATAARPSRCRITQRRSSSSRRCSTGRSRWVSWVVDAPRIGIGSLEASVPTPTPNPTPPTRGLTHAQPNPLNPTTTGDGLPLARGPADGRGRRRHHAGRRRGRDAAARDGARVLHAMKHICDAHAEKLGPPSTTGKVARRAAVNHQSSTFFSSFPVTRTTQLKHKPKMGGAAPSPPLRPFHVSCRAVGTGLSTSSKL